MFRGVFLNQYGNAKQAMNYIAAIKKLRQDVGYLKIYIKQKSFYSAENTNFENLRNIPKDKKLR